MKILFVLYDNDSKINTFPTGIAYLCSTLIKNGYKDITIYEQDIYHYPKDHLTEYLNKNKFDIVGFGVIGGYYQYKKLLEISDSINKSINRKYFKYIIGGKGVYPEPEYFLRKTQADYLVLGEGEETFLELVDLINFNDDINGTLGIAYFNKDKFVLNTKRRLIKDIDSIPFPAYELFNIDHYCLATEPGMSRSDRMMSVLSSRGCPYNCNFCLRTEKGYRLRSVENIIEEIKLLKKDYHINAIDFSDELLMCSEERTCEICEGIIKNKLNIHWSCNGRLNFATIDILKYMKAAGCVFINYGIESVNDDMLQVMHKNLTIEKIIKGVENTNEVGIIPGLNVIFGNIGETKEHLRNSIDFLKKYNLGGQLRTIRPVTPYPGSELYYYAIEKGLLSGVDDFYENKHVNSDLLSINFTNMSDEEFNKELKYANIELLIDYYKKNKENSIKQCEELYNNKNINFRGFRTV